MFMSINRISGFCIIMLTALLASFSTSVRQVPFSTGKGVKKLAVCTVAYHQTNNSPGELKQDVNDLKHKVFKTKTKPKVKVRYRGGNCKFELPENNFSTATYFSGKNNKSSYYASFFHSIIVYAHGLRGPPVA
jgi:hypothetical protein